VRVFVTEAEARGVSAPHLVAKPFASGATPVSIAGATSVGIADTTYVGIAVPRLQSLSRLYEMQSLSGMKNLTHARFFGSRCNSELKFGFFRTAADPSTFSVNRAAALQFVFAAKFLPVASRDAFRRNGSTRYASPPTRPKPTTPCT
jgi:hypothetical protein